MPAVTHRQPLTDVALRKLTPPETGQSELWDGKLSGFGVRVTPTGTKTFVLLYRHGGRARRLSLGKYPYLSLQQARQQAQAALSDVAQGRDPQGIKRVQKAGSTPGNDFAGHIERFVQSHCNRHNRASTAAETARILRSVFVPVWKHRALADIGKADILNVLDAIVADDRPSAARHAHAAIRKFFNWCVERGLLSISPCLTVKAPAKHQSRDRVLSDGELSALWQGAEREGYPFGPIFQLLTLTAQRRGEVVGMRWNEIDVANALWTIPASRTKNGRAHPVPLTPRVLEILDNLPRFTSEFVFPARGKLDRPYSGYSKGKRALDKAAGLQDWTLHDLRRTAATGMAKQGVAPHVVERILNHVSGTFAGVAGVYNRFGYLDEMRAALAAWERHVLESVGMDNLTRYG